jgi:hypothetical protein
VETPAQSGGRAEQEGGAGSSGAGPGRPKGAFAWELGAGPRRRRRPAGWRALRSLAAQGPASRGGRGRGHGGGQGRPGGGGAARTKPLERRGRGGAKLARRPGTSGAATGAPASAMGEHPSPGPAVAACAEAERIEELEPEAEERLPAAPEDVSVPSSTRQTFCGVGGGLGGKLPRLTLPAGQVGGFKVMRERPGLAGSPRARRD